MTTKVKDVDEPDGRDVGDQRFVPQLLPEIPESAKNGLEFCLWSLERAGVEFVNGQTAAYWHLISTLSQHIKGKSSV